MPRQIPEPIPGATDAFSVAAQLDQLRAAFVQAWRSGQAPRIEQYLMAAPAADRRSLLRDLLREELVIRQRTGESVTPADYLSRFPEDRDTVAQAFAQTDHRSAEYSTYATRCVDEASHAELSASPEAAAATTTPERYHKLCKLGEGAFGAVWLAEDRELRRQVALKEPRQDRLWDAADIETYLSEARVLASLDHPHIVPVYDVGRTAEGSCYVVSKLIDGMDLGAFVKQKPLSFDSAARLVAQVAEALQHTHNRGLVHRDIKPANILVDNEGRPYVADFGLALREEDFGKQPGLAGTPAYMSPEQARGEGHLIDGRSDIFSLGVVLYELLAGTTPFRGANWREVLESISRHEAKPLRQRNEAIPKELDRICLKALAKRAAERYPCAADFAEDLRHWSDPPDVGIKSPATVRIVPKGLRSFDADDCDFFLELLPGPRDRDGLPASLRFWKTRIENTEPDKTFRVGLAYGPSGCGKSSLLRAGLLPRLADHVVPVVLDATSDRTETQLLHALRRACADLPRNASLADTLVTIRRGRGIPVGRKLLLVLDQFEQWLYAHGAEQQTELATALRQCDGERIQALLLVRDDFYRDANRLMQQLEVPLREGQNQSLVDLFDPLHARRVLGEFGKAYGRLPENLEQLSPPQAAFLEEAVSGLTQDGKVICVQLALFADMLKGHPWTPAALREIGGTAGVGATFLEETFSCRTAPPQHRRHQDAARAVLRALLPTTGTDIKGRIQTIGDLRNAAGYANRPDDFVELLRILDSEVRLITPVSSETQEPDYQLTHDYLVPSLRDWLARKQRETRRGRVELRMEERAAIWSVTRENRHLPSLWEYLNIRTMTHSRHWTGSQRTMMARATQYHGVRSALGAVVLIALSAVGMVVRSNVVRQLETTRIRGLVGELTNAEPAMVPGIADQLAKNPELAAKFLESLLSSDGATNDDKRAKLHAQMATVARDPSLVEPLVEELLTGSVTYVSPIRRQLRPWAAELTERFLNLLRDDKAEPKRRFHAALALADYIPASDSQSWTAPDLMFVAETLVSSNAEFQPLMREALRPIQEKLLPNLERVFGDPHATDGQRLSAANAFVDYSANNVAQLSQLLAVATPEQYALIYPLVIARCTPRTFDDLHQIAATLPPRELGSVDRIFYGQRRANAAVALLQLGEHEKVLPVFHWTDDPEALTQFIFRCRPRGVRVEDLLECLRLVSAAPNGRYPRDTRYALLLALGEFELAEIPAGRRNELLAQLAEWYANEPNSGVHGAAGWLLRQWDQTEVATKIDQKPVPYSPEREWFTLAITVTPTPPRQTFYYTFIVFPPGEYTIGSVADEPERFARDGDGRERRHAVKLTRSFAVLDREITMAELIAYKPHYGGFVKQFNAQPTDAGFGTNWYDSVGFCRWLGEKSQLPESDQAYTSPDSLDKELFPREPNPSANWAPRDWPVDLSRRGFRLPTEAEWEIATRSGARTMYGYGSDAKLLRHYAWYRENSRKLVHRPKDLRPSVRGLFDMHGNAIEWTNDWFDDFDADAVIDPVGPRKGSNRVLRSGGGSHAAENCRSATRLLDAPELRMYGYGFRIVLSPSGAASSAQQEQTK